MRPDRAGSGRSEHAAGWDPGGIGGLTPLQRLAELCVTNVLEKHS